MIRARARALLTIAVAIAGAAAVALALARSGSQQRPPGHRPVLLLLTSLPLLFGEDFSLDQQASPALEALRAGYRVVPISVSSPADLAKGRLLMMAQPLAQPAEHLVTLDAWVQRGGRVLLLADPMLEWPAKRPLGDPLRPPPMFADTGLLAHWGLRLGSPDARGTKPATLGGYRIVTASPGSLSGRCDISRDRLVARCRIGRGRATIVADADLLDVQDLGSAAADNLNGVLGELAKLGQQ